MKTGLHDRLTASQRDRVAPDTGPMTGSINYQQPSTIRGEAHMAPFMAVLVEWRRGRGPCSRRRTRVDAPDQALRHWRGSR
jgi:hypothetical protein